MKGTLNKDQTQKQIKLLRSQIRQELRGVYADIKDMGVLAKDAEQARRMGFMAIMALIGIIGFVVLWGYELVFFGVNFLGGCVALAYLRRFSHNHEHHMDQLIDELESRLKTNRAITNNAEDESK